MDFITHDAILGQLQQLKTKDLQMFYYVKACLQWLYKGMALHYSKQEQSVTNNNNNNSNKTSPIFTTSLSKLTVIQLRTTLLRVGLSRAIREFPKQPAVLELLRQLRAFAKKMPSVSSIVIDCIDTVSDTSLENRHSDNDCLIKQKASNNAKSLSEKNDATDLQCHIVFEISQMQSSLFALCFECGAANACISCEGCKQVHFCGTAGCAKTRAKRHLNSSLCRILQLKHTNKAILLHLDWIQELAISLLPFRIHYQVYTPQHRMQLQTSRHAVSDWQKQLVEQFVCTMKPVADKSAFKSGLSSSNNNGSTNSTNSAPTSPQANTDAMQIDT
jgi:hypothetical protein